jgi:hypothetical protein
MKKKIKFPINEDYPLSKNEKTVLIKILDELEWKEYQRVKHQTSGYVESKVINYDEENINVEITIGVDGQWSDTTDYTVKRSDVLNIINS